MKKKYFGSKFYNSKSNTILLFALIILVLITLLIMFLNKDTYLPSLNGDKNSVEIIDKTMPPLENKEMIKGNKDDLVSFSISPNSKVINILSFRGIVKGGYFFEGNILINVLDSNNKKIIQSNAIATTEWMTSDPVEFEGYLDFSNAPKGKAYIEIHNDNASGLPENDKSILVPIIIQ